MSKKFKLFSKLKTNVIDHPKIRFSKLKRKKWIKLKNNLPQRSSEYGTLLLAKQKLRAFYGNCSEEKFLLLYKLAKKSKGNTGVNFLKLLERRLDSVLFRMRFANSFEEIHQFITHKHILINNKIVTSPSYSLKDGDLISVKEKSFNFIQKSINNSFSQSLNLGSNETTQKTLSDHLNNNVLLFTPDFMEIDYNTLEGIYIQSPAFDQIVYPFKVDLPKVMEYYEYKRRI